jgi:SAM-dependent methyltransferase
MSTPMSNQSDSPKVSANLIWVDVTSCPVCESTGNDLQSFQHDRGIVPLHYQYCRRCGLVFQSPRPDNDSLAAFYRREYDRLLNPGQAEVARNVWEQQRRASYFFDFLRRNHIRPATCLDVGFSMGRLMDQFRQGFGSTVVGIEPSKYQRRLAAELGFEVYASLAEVPSDWSKRFDLVTMSHVLEHLTDPVQTLRTIRERWLSDGGRLLLEVPDLIWHASYELSHVHAFTLDSLTNALAQAGLRPTRTVRHGNPYSRRIPFYLLVLAQIETGDIELVSPPGAFSLRVKRGLAHWLVRMYQRLVRIALGPQAMAARMDS